MSKRILALALALLVLFVTGCQPNGNGTDDSKVDNEGGESDEFVFKGIVTATDNDRHIEMEIIDSEVAFGIYWVLVSDTTTIVDKNGNSITRESIKAGDTIAVKFSGQVMMSYPPQIAAQRITLL